MFSPALGRAFRSASSVTAAPANPLGRAALSTAPQPFRPHQRRLSSSKPSVPADKLRRPMENATEELKAEGEETSQSSKLKNSSSASSAPVATRNIPSVPSTCDIPESELTWSVLLSQHRPTPIHATLLETRSMQDFDKVFKSRTESQILEETNRTLRDFYLRLVNEAQVIEESEEGIYHLDGREATHGSIESYVSQLQLSGPPPVPAPYDAQVAPTKEISLPTTHTSRSKAFREHVSRRRSGMLLISVKRQRKLKMKKHKYKKLMKRTRLLRRKLDRL